MQVSQRKDASGGWIVKVPLKRLYSNTYVNRPPRNYWQVYGQRKPSNNCNPSPVLAMLGAFVAFTWALNNVP